MPVIFGDDYHTILAGDKWLDKYLADLYVDEITWDVIDKITDDKLKTGVARATVNRLLEIVLVILNEAVKH
jgi:hypothetical protein